MTESFWTAVSAVATAIAAGAAWWAARATQRATEASLVADLLEEYASGDMFNALNTITTWIGKPGNKTTIDAYRDAIGDVICDLTLKKVVVPG